MATLKSKDVRKLSKSEREKKLKELKMEIIKSKANSAKTTSSKAREIRRIIARIHTINTQENMNGGKSKE